MEKIVKLYSNNSKKARLKRNKNKFQRVWDAEKQEYVKVRKNKYPVRPPKIRTEMTKEELDEKMKRMASRTKTPKKKSAPVITAVQQSTKIETLKKPETKQTTKKSASKKEEPKIYKIHGRNLLWDSKTLHYKLAALLLILKTLSK